MSLKMQVPDRHQAAAPTLNKQLDYHMKTHVADWFAGRVTDQYRKGYDNIKWRKDDDET